MATVVLDIDLLNIPPRVTGLERYQNAFVLIRFNGKPIGKTTFPVFRGQLNGEELRQHLVETVESSFWVNNIHYLLDWDDAQLKNFTPPTVTVAVCTRNRPDDLKRCLQALMQLPDDGQEYLVIDNCPSTDESQKIVEGYSRIRYIREHRPGLDVARNRALREATHEVVAFTDDDALPGPNWLRVIRSNFTNPLVACVTGLTMPLELETDGQELFEKYCSFSKGFRRLVHTGTNRNPLSTGSVGAGANMAIKRSVLDEVGYFDEALDAGTATQSGGDHEFFIRVLTHGYQIVYDPAALSWHRHRRSVGETLKAVHGYGVGVYALWTRTLLVDKELGILKFPYGWFMHEQFPNLIRALLRRPGGPPLNIVMAELQGCIRGPWAYFTAIRRLRKQLAKA